MNIRRFVPADAAPLSALIAHTLRTTNRRDYSEAFIESTVSSLSSEKLLERASWTHFYVAERDGALLGCGAIGSYWGSTTESSLFTIFVHPDCQGMGVGRRIIRTLEQDEFFLRANRIEIPASITAAPFYQRMGYGIKNGMTEPDAEGLFRMEKFR